MDFSSPESLQSGRPIDPYVPQRFRIRPQGWGKRESFYCSWYQGSCLITGGQRVEVTLDRHSVVRVKIVLHWDCESLWTPGLLQTGGHLSARVGRTFADRVDGLSGL